MAGDTREEKDTHDAPSDSQSDNRPRMTKLEDSCCSLHDESFQRRSSGAVDKCRRKIAV